jgi:hypothetical protein
MRKKEQKRKWRAWYNKNKETILKKKSEWQKKNREKVNAYQVEWHNRAENVGKNYKYVKKCKKKAKKKQ